MQEDHRHTLLQHLLQVASFEGWCDYALREAARRAGLAESDARAAFPAGMADAIAFYDLTLDAQLAALLPPEALAGKRIPERIELLVMERLRLIHANREAAKRLLSSRLLPWQAAASATRAYEIADTLWRMAGDSSTDFSFYTRRLTLATVYGAALLYSFEDRSEGLADTHAMLKRELNAVANFGKKKKELKGKLQAFYYQPRW